MILTRFKRNDTFTLAFLTACYTGLRTGEVFALTWNDIDFDNRIINVKHNIYAKNKDDKGKWFIGTTKTETGERQVYICETLLTAFKNYKKKQEVYKKEYGSQYYNYHLEEVKNKYGKLIEYRIIETKNCRLPIKNINLVFRKKDGRYSGTESIRYPFKIIHHKLGLKSCRFYDLRGNYATKILRNGVEIRDVADILGHSKIETTENYYISSTSESRMLASDTFEKITKSEIINEIINYT